MREMGLALSDVLEEWLDSPNSWWDIKKLSINLVLLFLIFVVWLIYSSWNLVFYCSKFLVGAFLIAFTMQFLIG